MIISSEAEDGAPFLQVLAKSSVYNAGEKKGIYCKGVNLQQRLEWYSPSNQIVEGKSTKNTRVFVERPKVENLANSLVPLIIHTTKIKDSGNWTCKSGNLSETIEILVGEKVNLPVRSENIQGEEGRSVRLDCVAKGYPLPVVQWYKDARSITEDPKKYVVKKKEDNYQLEIKNLTHRDSGEYVCRVTQEALSYYTDKRVQVTVHHKPLLFNTLTNEMYPSTYGVEEVYVLMNETKNITCSAIAYPPPSYRWFKRLDSSYDEPIEAEDTVQLVSTTNGALTVLALTVQGETYRRTSRTHPEEDHRLWSKLVGPIQQLHVMFSEDGSSSVLQLRVRDESVLGEYKCAANNTKGHVNILFHVSMGNKPSPPDAVSLVEVGHNTLTFSVNCSSCNIASPDETTVPDPQNLPVYGFKFQLTPAQERFPVPDWDNAFEFNVDVTLNDTYSVGPLPNGTTYHVRVCSRNAAGDSEWLEIDDATTAQAIKLVASLLIIITTVFFTHFH